MESSATPVLYGGRTVLNVKATDLPKLYRPTSHTIKLILQGSLNYTLM